ncbi:MAG: DUF5615 family PIN-like protein [Acidobacteria bacterium]|nr:DUF5615 family PIN-like protein [Acidobacteriota bacterium]
MSPKAAALLRAEGWDACHVIEVGLDRADDRDILDFASAERRVCVTLDHDFHAHLATTRRSEPSVVLLRIEGIDAAGQVALLKQVWAKCGDSIEAGAAVSVDGRSIRVRRLPLR